MVAGAAERQRWARGDEVAAKVFFQHYVPRLQERTSIGSDGWFVERADP